MNADSALAHLEVRSAVFVHIREPAQLREVGNTALKVFPWFVVGFVIIALLNTLGVFSSDFLTSFFKAGPKYLITCALVGVGFKVKLRDLFTKGIKPLILGGCTWICVACSSMIFVQLFSDYVNSSGLF